jgi:hypothetical protein
VAGAQRALASFAKENGEALAQALLELSNGKIDHLDSDIKELREAMEAANLVLRVFEALSDTQRREVGMSLRAGSIGEAVERERG